MKTNRTGSGGRRSFAFQTLALHFTLQQRVWPGQSLYAPFTSTDSTQKSMLTGQICTVKNRKLCVSCLNRCILRMSLCDQPDRPTEVDEWAKWNTRSCELKTKAANRQSSSFFLLPFSFFFLLPFSLSSLDWFVWLRPLSTDWHDPIYICVRFVSGKWKQMRCFPAHFHCRRLLLLRLVRWSGISSFIRLLDFSLNLSYHVRPFSFFHFPLYSPSSSFFGRFRSRIFRFFHLCRHFLSSFFRSTSPHCLICSLT